MRRKYSRFVGMFSLLFGIGAIFGCGGDSSDDFIGTDESQNAFVTDVRVDPDAVAVGEVATVRIDFEPTQSFDGSQIDTDIVLRIPPGVDYVTDSSEFDGSDVHGFEYRPPNTVEICPDGSRALTYNFAGGELTDNENSIRLSAQVYEGSGEVFFFAEASNFLFDSCDIGIEDADTLIIQ